ncbi:hypothetical protein [Engelhardtia mirabilis]|uniref:Carbohydrate binding domain protein n=1 Tax=Engelhardtia mirabilis TaxID=2528011 RepID=A0A518BDE2_9BACT|nr:hypothetical protein Pla133_00730 [Planctomycetes bacterium Pla133]QDU99336.1 hypothetical protein Pla86_00730 [Planctomycetes bacterium Pla86]
MHSRIALAVLAVLSSSATTSAQNLVLNGSFENNTSTSCKWNPPNAEFNSLMADVTAFGTASEIDIMQGQCLYGSPPQDGAYKIGLASNTFTQENDALALHLSSPLVQCKSYELEILAQAVVETFSPGVGPVQVGVSNDPNDFGTLVYSAIADTTGWTELGTTFVAPTNAQYLTLRQPLTTKSWSHIDNVSLVPVPSTNLTVPITVDVLPVGGGSALPTLIGSIAVVEQPGSQITATFAFDPNFALLDNCYDFRWINVERTYAIGGVAQTIDSALGLLPAIDPPPAIDPEPFYYTGIEWATPPQGSSPYHTEGVDSFFSDERADPTGLDSVIGFETYLVARDLTVGGLGAAEFCVLGGFSWTYDNASSDAIICGPLGPDPSVIQAALATGLQPGHTGSPGYPGWSVTATCPLFACSLLSGSVGAIEAQAGGNHALALDAGVKHAGQAYLVLGSASGTTPGVPVAGLTLPLNADAYFSLSLSQAGNTPFLNTLGVLDANGHGAATIAVPAGLSLAGLTFLDHAYFALSPLVGVTLVSNPWPLTILP